MVAARVEDSSEPSLAKEEEEENKVNTIWAPQTLPPPPPPYGPKYRRVNLMGTAAVKAGDSSEPSLAKEKEKKYKSESATNGKIDPPPATHIGTQIPTDEPQADRNGGSQGVRLIKVQPSKRKIKEIQK